MKCSMNCKNEAEFIVDGFSVCEKHKSKISNEEKETREENIEDDSKTAGHRMVGMWIH